MKFIKDKKLYNTDKCVLLEKIPGYIGWYHLYRSKTKKPFYILVYWLFGYEYYIKTKEEIYGWLVERGNVSVIERHFGDMIKEGC